MNKNTKIIFYQIGPSWYLPYTLHQAKHSCPNTEIIVLGENTNISGITHVSLDDVGYSSAMQSFQDHYVHMTTNEKKFEMHYFLRWFFLLEYMQKNHIDSIFYFDCDVLLYSSVSDILHAYSDIVFDCALLVPDQDHSSFADWAVSGHSSYWTLERLEEFCDFLIESYSQEKYMKFYQAKWNWHRETKTEGGICDMAALYLFWRERQDSILNWAMKYNGNVFDYFLCESRGEKQNEYVMHQGIKKITFINKKPMFTIKETGEMIRVHGVHFQGFIGKFLIPLYYKGVIFRGKIFSDIYAYCIRGKISIRKILRNLLKCISPKIYSVLESYIRNKKFH